LDDDNAPLASMARSNKQKACGLKSPLTATAATMLRHIRILNDILTWPVIVAAWNFSRMWSMVHSHYNNNNDAFTQQFGRVLDCVRGRGHLFRGGDCLEIVLGSLQWMWC